MRRLLAAQLEIYFIVIPLPTPFSLAGKLWLLAAQFEIRQRKLAAARSVLGQAIGRAPKDKASFSLSPSLFLFLFLFLSLFLYSLSFSLSFSLCSRSVLGQAIGRAPKDKASLSLSPSLFPLDLYLALTLSSS